LNLTDEELIQLEEAVCMETEADASEELHTSLEYFTLNEVKEWQDFKKSGDVI
jgi:hypothetical protein